MHNSIIIILCPLLSQEKEHSQQMETNDVIQQTLSVNKTVGQSGPLLGKNKVKIKIKVH